MEKLESVLVRLCNDLTQVNNTAIELRNICNDERIKSRSEPIAGFELIKEYPGSPKIGHFEPLTTGYFHTFREYWRPVKVKNLKDVLHGKG